MVVFATFGHWILSTWMASVLVLPVPVVLGHGLMLDPPGRNTVMNYQRLNKAPSYIKACPKGTGEINYSDKSNFCGGRGAQNANDGRCGACGDNWAAPYPRDHDLGGKYAKMATPVRAYLQGQIITVRVFISASHLGRFEFRLCTANEAEELRNGRRDVLTRCFEDPTRYLTLQTEEGELEYTGLNGAIDESRDYYVNLKLPRDVTCPRGCSLQWRYEAGNNRDSLKYQEHFVNCADILIASCNDYKQGSIAAYCGFGPTDELKQCDGGTGNDDNGSQPNEQGTSDQPTGNTQETGDQSTGYTHETVNETWNGEGSSNSPTGNAEQTENENLNAMDSDNEQTGNTQGTNNESWNTNDKDNVPTGTSHETGSETWNTHCSDDKETTSNNEAYPNNNGGTVTCEECSGLDCDNACCELSVHGTSPTFHSWCEANCFHTPPFCPTSHCVTVWTERSRCSRLLHELIRGLTAFDDHVEN